MNTATTTCNNNNNTTNDIDAGFDSDEYSDQFEDLDEDTTMPSTKTPAATTAAPVAVTKAKPVPVKYSFRGSLRRANLAVPLTFASLRAQVANSFPKHRAAFLNGIKVVFTDDEGDAIDVATNDELHAVRDCAVQAGRVLLLIVDVADAAKAAAAPAATQQPQALQQPQIPLAVQQQQLKRQQQQLKQLQRQQKLARKEAAQARRAAAQEARRRRTAERTNATQAKQQQQQQVPTAPPAATQQQQHTWILAPGTRVTIKPVPNSHGKPIPRRGRVVHYDHASGKYVVSLQPSNNTIGARDSRFAGGSFFPHQIHATDSAKPGVFTTTPTTTAASTGLPTVVPVTVRPVPRPVPNTHGFNAYRYQGNNNWNNNNRSNNNRVVHTKTKTNTGGGCAFGCAVFVAIMACFFTCGCCGVIPAIGIGLFVHFRKRHLQQQQARQERFRRSQCRGGSGRGMGSSRASSRQARREQRAKCRAAFVAALPHRLTRAAAAPVWDALPFAQLLALALGFVAGCPVPAQFVFATSVVALLVKGAGALAAKHLRHRANNDGNNGGCCPAGVKNLVAWVAAKRSDPTEPRACGRDGPPRKVLGAVFVALLGAAGVAAVVLSFPTAIFWAAQFLCPKCCAATTTVQAKVKTGGAAAAPSISLNATTTTTNSAASASSAAAAGGGAATSSSSATTAAAAAGGLDPMTVTRLLSAIQNAAPHRRAGLADRLHRAMDNNTNGNLTASLVRELLCQK